MFRILIVLLPLLMVKCGCELPQPPLGINSKIYVSNTFGNDETGNGSEKFPFKTLTFASKNLILTSLENDSDNYFIDLFIDLYLSPGEYSKKTGEIFPIVFDENSTFDDNHSIQIKSINFKINGADSVKLINRDTDIIVKRCTLVYIDTKCKVSFDGSVNSKFVFKNLNGVGVNIYQGQVYFKNTTIDSCKEGLVIQNNSETEIDKCEIINNSITGIRIGAYSHFEAFNSEIKYNGIGILIENGSQYINLGRLDTNGLNVIKNNYLVGICNNSDKIITAFGNYWNPYQLGAFECDSCSGGNNIGNTSSGHVLCEALQDINYPLFSEADSITIVQPVNNAVIHSSFPQFEWTPVSDKFTFLGVFSSAIIIKNHSIVNTQDLKWAWHSGLGVKQPITMKDGRVWLDNNFTEEDSFYLEPKRTYYWAIWAWDDKLEKIIFSSPQYYFRIE